MRVSKRTFKSHKTSWDKITSRINTQLRQGETPQHYFESMTKTFNNFNFLSKSQKGINLKKGIDLKSFYLDVALELVLTSEDWCVKAQNYMKRTHLWQNRTWAAEEGLGATVSGMEEDRIACYLYHSVPYGKYLEGENGFRYPKAGLLHVIEPTIQAMGPQLVSSLQGVINQ